MVIAGCRARRPAARPEAYQPDRRGLSEDTTTPCARQCLKSEVPKLHYAIHRQTAAELIKHRADSSTKNMGLTSWEGSPDGKILKTDVSVAKNYLSKEEMESLLKKVVA